MVRKTKNTIKHVDKLMELKKHLEYYYSNTSLWKEMCQDIKAIKEHMFFLDENKKVENARLAETWKKLFTRENKELKKENEILEEVYKQNVDTIYLQREEIKDLKEEIKDLKDDE